ncbi:MAG: hypothetical protein IPM53_25365 [Anaerolineaceae bacterium]|nr:hypothetical protein [Anaerolineaceae bacterium]
MANFQQRWIEILDRRYLLVKESILEDFWLELAQFMDFITNEEPFQPYIARLRREVSDWLEGYKSKLTEEVEILTQVRRELTSLYLGLDDSDTPQPEKIEDLFEVDFGDPYFQSIAFFDFLVARFHHATEIPVWPRNGDFDERVSTITLTLIRLLIEKPVKHWTTPFSEVREVKLKLQRNVVRTLCVFSISQKINSLPREQRPEALFLQIQYAREAQTHLRAEFISDCRIWPPAALDFLLNVRKELNPAPEQFESISEWSSARFNAGTLTRIPPNMEFCRALLRRVYERVRADLGTHLAHFELIQRYKARCMFYDRDRVIALANNASSNQEDALTRDMALYLFDNGVSTFYRAMQGVHEYDLIASSIMIEAKIYSRSSRQYLIRGISQLHAYVNGLETDLNNIRELYFVVFRLGGPLYDWPEKIEMNRWTIYPITIDLGSSRVSGSRQPRVRPITVEEIVGVMPSDGFEEEE